jgi:hypothetical protein
MIEVKLITRCKDCSARNRVQLPAGRKVRIRCGNCGAPITLTRREILLLGFRQASRNFFAESLPKFLLAVAETVAAVLRALFAPLRRMWRMLPFRLRRVLAWAGFAVLSIAYLVIEGTLKLASMLVLLAVLVLATLAIILAVRGPAAFRQIISQWTGSFIRPCPYCGHRYFRWLKNCPRCGEKGN